MALLNPSFGPSSTSRWPSRLPADADRGVIWLRGEHDVATVAALSMTIAGAMTRDDNDVVVDLSEVEFMDAATVSVIVRTRQVLHVQSRSLLLRAPSPCAARVLRICGIGLNETRPAALIAAAGCA